MYKWICLDLIDFCYLASMVFGSFFVPFETLLRCYVVRQTFDAVCQSCRRRDRIERRKEQEAARRQKMKKKEEEEQLVDVD